jgi:hypothetical protein
MHLDLVADERLIGNCNRFVEQGYGEIGDADAAREPHALDLAQRAKRLTQRDLRVRPMQQQKIDFGKS